MTNNIRDNDGGTLNPQSHICCIDAGENFEAFFAFTRDSTVEHALTMAVPRCRSDDKNFFYGLLIDTGSSCASIGGLNQYKAYYRATGQPLCIDENIQVCCRFGISATKSRETAQISFPFNNLILQVKIRIIEKDVSLLLSLADPDRLGVFYDNIDDKLVHKQNGDTAIVTRFHDHLFLHWNPIIQFLFTENDLRRLHRRVGHPKSDELHNLLKRSELKNVDYQTRQFLESITRQRKLCQQHAPGPCWIKFSLRKGKNFSHTIFVDMFYVDKSQFCMWWMRSLVTRPPVGLKMYLPIQSGVLCKCVG